MLDQQDPINAKRRNDVSCRSIPVKCLREYTQYQNLLQLHSSQLSLKDCQCLRETCVIPAVLGKPSALIESNREHNQAHSLPEVLSISPNLNKNINFSTSFLAKFQSHQDLLFLPRILSISNRLLFPLYPTSTQSDPPEVNLSAAPLCSGAAFSSCP